MTLLETKISALSKYFNAACFAGKWTSDKFVDEKLSKFNQQNKRPIVKLFITSRLFRFVSFFNFIEAKYSNLCELCESGCDIGDMYHGRTGALVCLTENIGDIAWVRLDDAFRHFKVISI